ncbi:hypothetical protein M3J09_001072 [Ascochyta lentis]
MTENSETGQQCGKYDLVVEYIGARSKHNDFAARIRYLEDELEVVLGQVESLWEKRLDVEEKLDDPCLLDADQQKLLNECDRVDEGIKGFGNRRDQLLMEEKESNIQRRAWLEEVNTKIIVPYSKSWNLEFAKNMQRYLPRELRHVALTHLWTREKLINRHGMGTWGITRKEHRRTGSHARSSVRQIPHFLKKDYVGKATAYEAAEIMYGHVWSRDKHIKMYGMLHDVRFLCGDPFDVGHDASSTLRRLEITCEVDRYRVKNKCGLRSSCTHTASERAYTYQDKLRSEFAPLLNVVNKMGFQLEVVFIQRNVRLGVLIEVLETFADVYHAYQQAGARLKIDWKYAQCEHTILDSHQFTRDLEPFFAMPRNVWRAGMLADFDNARLTWMHDEHVRFLHEPRQGISDKRFVHKMWDESEDDSDGENCKYSYTRLRGAGPDTI